jgi:hypothetical protein
MADYLRDIADKRIETVYRTALENSVAYMMLTRCGIDADRYFDADDFLYISEFNTPETATALGIASSDISEMCLREISAAVRTLDAQKNTEYNIPTQQNKQNKNSERSNEYERNLNIPHGGRLPRTEPDSTGGRTDDIGQIRGTAGQLPETARQDIVREPADDRETLRTSGGNRAGGTGAVDPADGGGTSGGNDAQRPDTRIKPLPTEQQQLNFLGEAEEIKPSAFSISQQIIDEYDLQLGTTVYMGIEEYEINAINDTRVELLDVNMPMFTVEMPRDEFEQKLRENSLNDGLIKSGLTEAETEPPQSEPISEERTPVQKA